MSALPNQAYANLIQPYWLKAGAPTPSGQSVPELSVIGAGSIIEERLLTTPSNAQIQINTLVGNTRSFKMGLFFTPDLVNPVPANNSMRIDVGNALPAITLTQSNITFTQPLILDTLFNTCNFTITQTSTSTTLSNGASVIAMNNNGVIAMTNSTSIITGGQSNLTSASNVRFKNASGDTEVLSSGGSLQLNGVNVSSGCNDTYLTVDPNGFQGVQFNTAKRTGWLPEAGKVVSMVGIVDPANSNFGAFVVNLDNTISNLFKTPFGVGGDYVFAQDVFKVLNTSNSNLVTQLNATDYVVSNTTLNRYVKSTLDGLGQYVTTTGTISPGTSTTAILISNSGVVSFPQGIDLSVFSNAFSSSNSIGGNVLSNGTLSNSGTGSNSIGGVTLSNGRISNDPTSSNSIGGISLNGSRIIGGANYASGLTNFYDGFSSFGESVTLPPGIGSVYQSPYTFDTGQYMVFINQRAYETQSLVGFYYIGVWTENNTTPGAYNYNIQTNFQNQVGITFTNVGSVITNQLLMSIFNFTAPIPIQIDIFYTIAKLGG